jgi:hypothetical protein
MGREGGRREGKGTVEWFYVDRVRKEVTVGDVGCLLVIVTYDRVWYLAWLILINICIEFGRSRTLETRHTVFVKFNRSQQKEYTSSIRDGTTLFVRCVKIRPTPNPSLFGRLATSTPLVRNNQPNPFKQTIAQTYVT